LLGVALGNIVLISLSQQEFQRGNYVTPLQPGRGEGFTEVVIHESGHMLGLQHPHNFGPVGDFMLSVMGYYTLDYVFGQIDKDALRRAHVDQIYLEADSLMKQISAKDPIGALNIQNQLKGVDAKYSQMDYAGALSLVLNVEQAAKSALASGTSNFSLPAVYLVVGGVIGFVVAWILVRRRSGSNDAGRQAAATTPTVRASKFCTNCGKQAVPNTMYCYYCGARVSQ